MFTSMFCFLCGSV